MADKTGELRFIEDNYHRTLQNLSIMQKHVCRENHIIDQEESRRLYVAIEEFMAMGQRLYDNFFEQFKHNPRARRVCPNPNCHGIYAYFFEDWLYCPKCGTKLVGKGLGMEESEDSKWRIKRSDVNGSSMKSAAQ